jgi:hypothetical protein
MSQRASDAQSRQAVRLTPTAASFDPRLGFDAWQEIGRKVGSQANATRWWLGDWLAFGRFKYGRRYKNAIAVTGLDYQTLRNYATVARRFEPSRRRVEVSFQHHAEVCGLPDEEQDRLLALAASLGWSRNELRRHARSSSAESTPAARTGVLELSVDGERRQRWRRAAECAGCSFEEWAVRTLDEAASAYDQGRIPTDAR